MAYEDGIPIGWCNADEKQNYDRLQIEHNPEIWVDSKFEGKILSIVCFLVSPNMRGKGVASALLGEACSYAETSGYQYIEAYPSKEDFSVIMGNFQCMKRWDFR